MNSASITSAIVLPANSRISSAAGQLPNGSIRSISSASTGVQAVAGGNETPRTDTVKASTAAVSSSSTVDISAEAAEKSRQAQQQEKQQLRIDKQVIEKMASRDREVRNHERAHAAVGGQYAGAPRYQYERGPDGVNYAVSGEVSISTGPISGDPQATIEKAQVVRRSALAPAEPSGQDRKVAAQATQMEAQARVELLALEREERIQAQADREQRNDEGAEQAEDNTLANNTSARLDNNTLVNRATDNTEVSSGADENLDVDREPAASEANRRLLSSSINAQIETTQGNIISLFA